MPKKKLPYRAVFSKKKKPTARKTPRKCINGPALLAQTRAICRGAPPPKTTIMTRRKPKSTTAHVNEDAFVKGNGAFAAVSRRMARALDLTPPFSIVTAIDKLLARVAATTAWTQLAHERLATVLDKTSTGKQPTLGSVLVLIETLIADHLTAARQRNDALGAERARIGDALRSILDIDQRYHTVDELLTKLATAHKDVIDRANVIGAELTAADELIAHLAFNLAEGDEQEQIETASPADQRMFLAARAGRLIERSIACETAANRKPPTDVATRMRTLREDRQQCDTLFTDQPSMPTPSAEAGIAAIMTKIAEIAEGGPTEAVADEIAAIEEDTATTTEIAEIAEAPPADDATAPEIV